MLWVRACKPGNPGKPLGSLEPIQKAITEFRRDRARAKLTKGLGGPRLSRTACPIPNVTVAANCVTAIRTRRNEIRRIAHVSFTSVYQEPPRLTIFFRPVACRHDCAAARDRETSERKRQKSRCRDVEDCNVWRTTVHSSDASSGA